MAEAVDALEKDHEFLTAGDVFTDDLVQMWITWKRQEELDPMALRPHPYEFHLYYDSYNRRRPNHKVEKIAGCSGLILRRIRPESRVVGISRSGHGHEIPANHG